MLRGRAALLDKVQAAAPGASRLLAASPSTRRQHVPFTAAQTSSSSSSTRQSVRASSYAGAPGSTGERAPRAPRVEKTYTVTLESLKAGEELDATVATIATFGAFVEIGAKTQGLIHISQLGSGFVKNVADVVSVGQKVRVKVMSVDVAQSRLALSLIVDEAEGAAGGDDDDEEDEQDAAGANTTYQEFDFNDDVVGADDEDEGEYYEEEEDEEEGGEYELPDGQTGVFPEEMEGAVFLTPTDDSEMTAEALADYESNEESYEYVFQPHDDMPALPLYERLQGTVTRVEAYAVFVAFPGPDGASVMEGVLPTSEMKAPASKLTEEELEEFEPVDEDLALEGMFDDFAHSEYIDVGEIEDATKYYKVDDAITVFYIGFTEAGETLPERINLSQFTDAELLGAAIIVDEGEEEAVDDGEDGEAFEPDEGMMDDFEDEELLAMDPDRMLEAVEEAEAVDPAVEAAAAAVAAAAPRRRFGDEEEEADEEPGNLEELLDSEHLDVEGRTRVGSSFLMGMDPSAKVFRIPARPMRRGAAAIEIPELSNLGLNVEDFDLDPATLQDYWTNIMEAPTPKGSMKKAGYRLVVTRDGVEEVQTEKKVADSQYLDFSFRGDNAQRANAFLQDMLEADADEAELPMRAYRRPGVHAAAVVEVTATLVKSLRQKTGAGMMDCKKALVECSGDMDQAVEWLRKKGLSGADKKAGRLAAEGAVSAYIHPGSRLGVLLEINCETDFVGSGDVFRKLVAEVGMVVASSPELAVVSVDDVSAEMMAKERAVEMAREDIASKPEVVRAKIVEGRLDKIKAGLALLEQPSLRDSNKTVGDIIKETMVVVGENIKIRRFVRYQLGEGLEKRTNDFAAEVAQQTQAKAPSDKPKPRPPPQEASTVPTVPVSASAVKELRQMTGVGMMDCKRALAESNNDMVAATEWLRKKGLSGADKKSSRVAAEGNVVMYIHPGSRLGVLLEVNCETDFVGISEKFQALVKTIAMQIAASPMVMNVSADEIPADVMERELAIEMGREDIKGKPDAIRQKIAEGRVKKTAAEMALLEQPYIMDSAKTVSQVVTEAIASIGEKISIRRFTRFQLGEGLEKKSNDFAADVAAATGQKA